MTFYLFLEQTLNAFQLGVMLFLMAAGLTLVFGIMNMINLAHGSFYMIGAYVAAYVSNTTGSFFIGVAVNNNILKFFDFFIIFFKASPCSFPVKL